MQMADFITKDSKLKIIIRLSLLPIAGMSWIALTLGLIPTLAFILLFIFILNSLVRVGQNLIHYSSFEPVPNFV